jgi:hypothetical protein
LKVPIDGYNVLNLDAPVLSASEYNSKKSRAKLWRIWCEHCQEHHLHGVGEGHREAHCTHPESPYRTGYNLVLSGAVED